MRKSLDNVNHSPAAGRGEPPRAPRDEDDVLELVHQLMHLYRARQYQVLRDGPHDVTHMESKVLGFFGRRPGATQSELAESSGRDKAQLARLIKGLRERGLLDGEPDAQDRRQVRLRLTEAGRLVIDQLRQQAQELAERAVTGMDAAEQAQLRGLLLRVHANLERRG